MKATRTRLSIIVVISLLFTTAFSSVFFLIPTEADTDPGPEPLSTVLTLDPNGDGHELDWTPKSAGDHYVEVDEGYGGPPDDDTTYNSKDSGNQEDYWNLEDHTTETGTISSVQAWLRIKHSAGDSEEFNFALGNTSDSSEHHESDVANSETWTTYTHDFGATNPLTSAAWTWTDIDNLELGIRSRAIGGWGGTIYVTVGWVNVTYSRGPGTNYWSAVANDDWSTDAAWSLGLPIEGDDIVFDTTSTYNCNIDVSPPNLDSFLMDTGYTGTVSLNANTLTINYTADTSSLTGTEGTFDAGTGVMIVGGSWDTNSATFTFTKGTSTLKLTGTGNLAMYSHVQASNLHNLRVAYPGKTTTATRNIGTGGILMIGSGTYTRSSNWQGHFLWGTETDPLDLNGGTVDNHIKYETSVNSNIVSTTYQRGVEFQSKANPGNIYTLQGAITAQDSEGAGDYSVKVSHYVATRWAELDTANYDMTLSTEFLIGEDTIPGGIGIVDAGTSTIDVGTDVIIDTPVSYIEMDASTWTVAGDWTSVSTDANWDEGTSSVTFDKNGAQNVDNNELDFYDVTIGATSTTTFTDGLDIGGNLTVLGKLKAGAIYIEPTGSWFDFYIPNPGQAWLNGTVINTTDLNEYYGGFNYSIGSGSNTTLNEFSIENAATDSSHNFTSLTFAQKSAGIVAHWNTTAYTGSETIKFTVTNLTASEEYKVYIDDELANTTTADGSGVIFFSNNSLTHNHIYLTWSPGISPASIEVTLRKSDNQQERIDVGFWGNMTVNAGDTNVQSFNFLRIECNNCDGVDDSFWVNWSGTSWDSAKVGDSIAIDGNYRLFYYETTSSSACPDDGGWGWTDGGVDADGDFQITFANSGTTYMWVKYQIEAVPSPLGGADDYGQAYVVTLDR